MTEDYETIPFTPTHEVYVYCMHVFVGTFFLSLTEGAGKIRSVSFVVLGVAMASKRGRGCPHSGVVQCSTQPLVMGMLYNWETAAEMVAPAL